MHSPTDNTVGVENARALFEAAKHPKSFVSLDGADHLLNDPVDAAFAGSVISAWARRYIILKAASGDAEEAHEFCGDHYIMKRLWLMVRNQFLKVS